LAATTTKSMSVENGVRGLQENTCIYDVYNYLKTNKRWVDSQELRFGGIGGEDGPRRVRELRALGVNIQTQPVKGTRRVAYRLAKGTTK